MLFFTITAGYENLAGGRVIETEMYVCVVAGFLLVVERWKLKKKHQDIQQSLLSICYNIFMMDTYTTYRNCSKPLQYIKRGFNRRSPVAYCTVNGLWLLLSSPFALIVQIDHSPLLSLATFKVIISMHRLSNISKHYYRQDRGALNTTRYSFAFLPHSWVWCAFLVYFFSRTEFLCCYSKICEAVCKVMYHSTYRHL